MKLNVGYPTAENEVNIVKTCGKAASVTVKTILKPGDIEELRKLYDSVNCDDKIVEYIVSILNVTRADTSAKKQSRSFAASVAKSNDITRYIHFGASPRAGIAMLQCAKVRALFEGRDFVLPEDVKAVACNVLRHRLVLSYEAAADNVTSDEIISRILDFIPLP